MTALGVDHRRFETDQAYRGDCPAAAEAASPEPALPVTLDRTRERPGRDVWLWRCERCPFCSEAHQHGGGPLAGDPRALLSERAAHCPPSAPRPDYYLLQDADPAWTARLLSPPPAR